MSSITHFRLRDDIDAAAAVVAPSWPLSSVIAVNPLSGFEGQPYRQAIDRAELLFGSRGHLTLAEYRRALGAGRITTEGLGEALLRAVPDVEALAPVSIGGQDVDAAEVLLADLVGGADDPAPQRSLLTVAEEADQADGGQRVRTIDLACAEWCAALASGDLQLGDADELLAQLYDDLDRLRVPAYAQRRYLERHIAAMAGWASHLRWRDQTDGTRSLAAFLALRVRAEVSVLSDAGWFQSDGPLPRPAAASLRERAAAVALYLGAGDGDLDAIAATLGRLPARDRAQIWHDAYERAVHGPLVAAIEAGSANSTTSTTAPSDVLAQVICCIDVRSEGLRRNLEQVGAYETHGYAGFFGLPLHLVPLTGGSGTDQCPVLLTPSDTLCEVSRPGAEATAQRQIERRRLTAASDDAWRAAKYHPVAPLALAEGAGWLAGPLAAMRTAMPSATAWIADRLMGRGRSSQRSIAEFDRTSLSIEQQATWVGGMLNLGLASPQRDGELAPLVVLCGHTSRDDNNPAESGLACGACAGHAGGSNARVAAAMANDPEVRAILAERGTPIGDGTWFLAAEHDTSTDRVQLLDADLAPAGHAGHLRQLCEDLQVAGDASAHERATTLGAGSVRQLRARGRDWAEPVAELGLAGNHAFVIGPRQLTQRLNLDRRVFLHSYEPDDDIDGATLGAILTAPLVVAQWINAQYNFSATDPEIFGSGSKAVHNPIGDIGVLSGPGGDLRRGLALQSVRAGEELLHEPVRLLAVVEGSPHHIDAAIDGSETLRQLIENDWISLVARSNAGERFSRRTAEGWVPWHSGETRSQAAQELVHAS